MFTPEEYKEASFIAEKLKTACNVKESDEKTQWSAQLVLDEHSHCSFTKYVGNNGFCSRCSDICETITMNYLEEYYICESCKMLFVNKYNGPLTNIMFEAKFKRFLNEQACVTCKIISNKEMDIKEIIINFQNQIDRIKSQYPSPNNSPRHYY